jgi:hypothetical protein
VALYNEVVTLKEDFSMDGIGEAVFYSVLAGMAWKIRY